jgi:hypothetical protein
LIVLDKTAKMKPAGVLSSIKGRTGGSLVVKVMTDRAFGRLDSTLLHSIKGGLEVS